MPLKLNPATQKLVEKAAAAQQQSVEQWIDDVLQTAAENAIKPGAVAYSPEALQDVLKKIDRRLGRLENSPIHQGAQVVTDRARTLYEKVESNKWFEDAKELSNTAFHSASAWFKKTFEVAGKDEDNKK